MSFYYSTLLLSLLTLILGFTTFVSAQLTEDTRCPSLNKLFDPDQRRCVSKVGHPCVYTWFHELESIAPPSIPFTSSGHMDRPDCVKNAFCTSEGLCVCKTKYYETSNGTCQPLSRYMEPCNSEIRCVDPLKCENGLCKCENPDVPCYGLAGRNCQNSLCTANAICSSLTNKCMCRDGFYPDLVTGHCLPRLGYLAPCTEDSQCGSSQPGQNFICQNGRCDCDSRTSMYENVTVPLDNRRRWEWDMAMSTISRCVGKAGHPCVDGFCTAAGFCTALSDRTIKPICACVPGTLGTKSGHCKYAYGEPCESEDECVDELHCKNNECSCKYADQRYEEEVHKCFSRVGGPCDFSSELDCMDTAKCWPVDREGPGHCICQDGYVETIDGDCAGGYNARCDSKSTCVSNLVCRNNICQCDHFAVFDERERKCLGLVGATCGLPSDDRCIHSAFCKQRHPKFRGHCECGVGYVETTNYTCIKIPVIFTANDLYNVL